MEAMDPVALTVSDGAGKIKDKDIDNSSSVESTFDSQEDDSSFCCSSDSDSDTASVTESLDDEDMVLLYPPTLFGLEEPQPTQPMKAKQQPKPQDDKALGLVLTMDQVMSLRKACSGQTPTKSPAEQPSTQAPPQTASNSPPSATAPTDAVPMPRLVLESILRKHYGRRGCATATSFSYKTLSVTTSYFVPQHINVSAYHQYLKAAEENDCAKMKELSSQHSIQTCNKFGESVFHVAAKRGQTNVLKTLVVQCGGSLRVCCDTGRTPLHDACWTATPNFTCIRFLLQQSRELLWIQDQKKGTPLDYVPASAASVWKAFLQENVDLIVPERVDI